MLNPDQVDEIIELIPVSDELKMLLCATEITSKIGTDVKLWGVKTMWNALLHVLATVGCGMFGRAAARERMHDAIDWWFFNRGNDEIKQWAEAVELGKTKADDETRS